MAGPDKNVWTKKIYYQAFIICNLFAEVVDQRYLTSVSEILEKLPKLYNSINPPISLLQRDNYLFWKNLPNEAHIDILCFIALENFRNKFKMHQMNKLELITETLLKVIIKDFGWGNMPDKVIDLAKRGFDHLKRRVYNSSEALKYMMISHVVACEKERIKIDQKKFNLELNDENAGTLSTPISFMF